MNYASPAAGSNEHGPGGSASVEALQPARSPVWISSTPAIPTMSARNTPVRTRLYGRRRNADGKLSPGGNASRTANSAMVLAPEAKGLIHREIHPTEDSESV